MLAAVLAACGSPDPDAALPSHEGAGFRFRYPAEWAISRDTDAPRPDVAERFVSVEGPEDAILIVHRIAGDPRTAEAYLRAFVTEELGPAVAERGRISAVTADVAGASLDGVRMHFEIGSTGFATSVFRIEGGGAPVFVVSQSSLADERSAEEGFAIVRRSLRVD